MSLGDGLHLNWSNKFLYLFPLLPLMARVIHKIQCQKPDAILIAPWWPRQLWFPALLQLSRRTFIKFPEESNLLQKGHSAIRHHDIG